MKGWRGHLDHVSWIGVACTACMAQDALAQTIIEVNATAPALDRWSYPFANDPGGNHYAAVFASLASTGFDPQFDNRDGQMNIGYNTEALGIQPGLGPGAYTIVSVELILTIESNQTFRYDPTTDPFQVWLPVKNAQHQDDADLGHPIELFGTGFRFGLSAATLTESTPFSPLGSFGKGIRAVFPMSFTNGECVDVSNNIDEMFEPTPFAIGTTNAVSPGELVPAGAEFHFQLDVADADIHRYLRNALDDGSLVLTIASIFPAEQQQSGTYPRFYTKENLAVLLGLASAARLEMTVHIDDRGGSEGDINGDGNVNVDDLLSVINAWGPCSCCAADVNNSGGVDVDDLLIVINTWG
jgi:hypothetical protein